MPLSLATGRFRAIDRAVHRAHAAWLRGGSTDRSIAVSMATARRRREAGCPRSAAQPESPSQNTGLVGAIEQVGGEEDTLPPGGARRRMRRRATLPRAVGKRTKGVV